jgi:hypothetical protein
MLFQPSEESSLFKGLFIKKQANLAAVAIDESSDNSRSKESDLEGKSEYWVTQERNYRFERLEEVIRAVKCLKDKRINNKFDDVMEVEMGELSERRCDTSFEMAFPLPLEKELDQQLEKKKLPIPKPVDLNKSYPGLNESYDGNDKRIQLLEFFERQAIEDAENERRFIEKLALKNRFKDKETMYDGALIDNCFFAPKTKADNVAQTVIELKEQGIDPLDLLPIPSPEREPTEPEEPEEPNLKDTMISNRPLLPKP